MPFVLIYYNVVREILKLLPNALKICHFTRCRSEKMIVGIISIQGYPLLLRTGAPEGAFTAARSENPSGMQIFSRFPVLHRRPLNRNRAGKGGHLIRTHERLSRRLIFLLVIQTTGMTGRETGRDDHSSQSVYIHGKVNK
jgi:hypothetical protein